VRYPIGMRALTLLAVVVVVLSSGCPRYNIDKDGYVIFHDEDSFTSTNEVRDVDGEVVLFRADDDMLVFDSRRYDGWPVDDEYLIRDDKIFEVRFGTEDGERRAYWVELAGGTVCDAVVEDNVFNVFPTNVPVPGGS